MGGRGPGRSPDPNPNPDPNLDPNLDPSFCACWGKTSLLSGPGARLAPTSFLLFFSSPPFPPNPSQTFLPDSFVCQDPGYHGYQLALYEHLIPHLNIPSYLW